MSGAVDSLMSVGRGGPARPRTESPRDSELLPPSKPQFAGEDDNIFLVQR